MFQSGGGKQMDLYNLSRQLTRQDMKANGMREYAELH